MGLVIELLGLPGAGKSTLVTALDDELTRRGVRTTVATRGVDAGTPPGVRLLRKSSFAASELALHPVAGARAVAAIGASAQPGPDDAALRSLAWLVAQRLVRQARRRPGLHLLDEGPLQAVWSLGVDGNHEALVARWREHRPGWAVGHVVLVLPHPPELVRTRLANRTVAHGRLDRRTGPDQERALREGHDRLLQMAHGLPALSPAYPDVVWLSDAPPEDLAVATADLLVSRHLRGRGRTGGADGRAA